MANWVYPVAQEITGTTKIKEADNKIQAAMDDLNDWANNTGAYSPNLGASFNYTTLSAMTDVLLTSIATDDGLRWNGTDFVNTPMYNKSQVDSIDTALSTAIGTINNTALPLKAPLASPVFTGIPSAPTASNGTNTTQIATTAFVLSNSVQAHEYATDTLGGVVKLRLSGNTLYITTNGNNA